MCINEMTVILKSLGVASANREVAELFCKNRFGCAAVETVFERGLAVDQVRDWMIDNVGQQTLHTAAQRVGQSR